MPCATLAAQHLNAAIVATAVKLAEVVAIMVVAAAASSPSFLVDLHPTTPPPRRRRRLRLTTPPTAPHHGVQRAIGAKPPPRIESAGVTPTVTLKISHENMGPRKPTATQLRTGRRKVKDEEKSPLLLLLLLLFVPVTTKKL